MPRQHAEQKVESSLLLFGTLHFARTFLTTDDDGCPSLLCYKINGFYKDELHCIKKVVAREEFLSIKLHDLFIELVEEFLSYGFELIHNEGLDKNWGGLKADNPSLSCPAMSMVLVTWSLT